TITVTSSCDSDTIYKISHRCASDSAGEEYFLIENRGACGYDLKLLDGGEDRQGVVIWYVDHTMLLGQNIDGTDTIQYDSYKDPSDPAWPGVHSRVSLLPADGQFEMENNKNRGDAGDAFRRDATDRLVGYKISNAGVSLNGGLTMPYPTTKSIATGIEKSTGITIEILDSVGYDMRVKVTLQDASGKLITQPPPSTPQPTSKVFPTSPPAPAPTDSPVTPGNKLGSNGASKGTNGAAKGVGGGSSANVGPSPTTPPTDGPVGTNPGNGAFTCDNLSTDQFTVTGVGKDPYATLYRECKFISNNPTEREVPFCNADDERSPGNKVYMKCQKECASITGCNR
ncbi:MAG: hypothetical protein SGILL_008282, partial [Bacillariaceae sp.]